VLEGKGLNTLRRNKTNTIIELYYVVVKLVMKIGNDVEKMGSLPRECYV